MAEPPVRTARRTLDEAALAHVLQRLRRAPQPPWLHAEAARRMAERLPVIKAVPDVVVDWWPRLGASGALLRRAYPRARIVAVDAAGAGAPTQPWWSPRRWSGRDEIVAPDAVAAGAAQLVWANMMLQASVDPQAEMSRWRDALAIDGFLMFSTLGPGTFEDLSALYRAAGWGPPFAPFVDMHDLGDMLIEAGFADPVMDQEVLTLSWPDAGAMLAELRALGGNVACGRHPGLRTPRWRSRLEQALAGPGRPTLRVELVYGHAFKPAPRPRVAPTTSVPLDDLRAMVRTGRKPQGR